MEINKLNKEERPSIFLFQLISFFFLVLFLSFLFLFNIFLIHLLFRKKFTGPIVGKKISPEHSDGNKQFFFFGLKTDHFKSLHAFSKKPKLKGKFSDNLTQNICRRFHILAQFLWPWWSGTRLLSPENEFMSCRASCGTT